MAHFLPANLIMYTTASFREPSERGCDDLPVIELDLKSIRAVISFGKFVREGKTACDPFSVFMP